MKKLLFAIGLFFLLFSSAWAGTNPYIIGSNITANPCPSGTYLFATGFDYTGDTDKACFTNGTVTKDGTQSGGTLSTEYGQTGYGFRKTGGSQYVTWAISGEDGLDNNVGTIWASVYISSISTNCRIIESYVSGCAIYFTLYSDRRLEGYMTDNSVLSTDIVPLATWTDVAYSFNADTNNHSVKVGTGSWVAAAEAIGCSATPDDITVGRSITGSETCTVYIDDIFVFPTYQAEHP